MILVRARYPFEVDFETGSSSTLYPSKKISIAVAREMVRQMAETRDISLWVAMTDKRDIGDGGFFGKVRIEFDQVEIVPLSKENVCAILNAEGGHSERDSKPIGHIDISFKITPEWDWPGI